jgi:hypothetical protein
MPGGAGAASAKKKITATVFTQRILPAVNTAIPLHIETNIKGGWKRPFPMTDLTPAACASTNKARDKKEDRQLIQRDGKFVLAEGERDDLSGDKLMTATDFLLASKNLIEAVKRWYTPESLRKAAAKNLKKHFKVLFDRDEFRRPEKFPRIAMYNTEVLLAFVACDPANRFDVSTWQPDIWSDVVTKHQDEVAEARSREIAMSFRAGGVAPQLQQPPRQFQQQQVRAGGQRGQGAGQNEGQGGQGGNDGLRCMACGRRGHIHTRCRGQGAWLIKPQGGRFWEAPERNIKCCFAFNSGGCPDPRRNRPGPCNFAHCCTLCGAGSGAAGCAPTGHSAQQCTTR